MKHFTLFILIFLAVHVCEASISINQLVNKIAKETPANMAYPYDRALPRILCVSNEKKVSDRTVYLFYSFQEKGGIIHTYTVEQNYLFIKKPKEPELLQFSFEVTTETDNTYAFTLHSVDDRKSSCSKGTLLTQRTPSEQKHFGFFELTSSEINKEDWTCRGFEHAFDKIQTNEQQPLTCYY
ncbi:MAG: hypothetical protein ACXVCR_15035 [Bdellovibrio sp.]